MRSRFLRILLRLHSIQTIKSTVTSHPPRQTITVRRQRKHTIRLMRLFTNISLFTNRQRLNSYTKDNHRVKNIVMLRAHTRPNLNIRCTLNRLLHTRHKRVRLLQSTDLPNHNSIPNRHPQPRHRTRHNRSSRNSHHSGRHRSSTIFPRSTHFHPYRSYSFIHCQVTISLLKHNFNKHTTKNRFKRSFIMIVTRFLNNTDRNVKSIHTVN